MCLGSLDLCIDCATIVRCWTQKPRKRRRRFLESFQRPPLLWDVECMDQWKCPFLITLDIFLDGATRVVDTPTWHLVVLNISCSKFPKLVRCADAAANKKISSLDRFPKGSLTLMTKAQWRSSNYKDLTTNKYQTLADIEMAETAETCSWSISSKPKAAEKTPITAPRWQ